MTYPPPPWTLNGFGFQTLQLLDIDRVRPLIPSQLEIVSVFPGKTLGGLYLAAYGDSSTLTYSELIIVSAIARGANQLGAWISHIYVDHPDSVAGGREIWGLPKELADFRWQLGDRPTVEVVQNGQTLCTLTSRWQLPGWTQPLTGSVFSQKGSTLISFLGQGHFKWHLADVTLQVPSESPFAWLGIGQPWLNVYLNPLHLVAKAPSPVRKADQTL
jgi:acetoacetate decarboxylase